MAFTPINLAGVTYGGSVLDRVVEATYDIRYVVKEGSEDAALGVTHIDTPGIRVTGRIVFADDFDLEALFTTDKAALVYTFTILEAPPSTKTRVFDFVSFGEPFNVPIDPTDDSGQTSLVAVEWEGVFDSTDDSLDDFTRIA